MAIEEAHRAVGLVPLSADARLVLADLFFERAPKNGTGEEDRRLARQHYTTFLTLSPPHRADVEHAESRLTKLAASAP